jgi:hypothetical protein
MTTASCMVQSDRTYERRRDMNTLVNNGLKALACGTAAVAITLAMSLSFVQSTAVVHNTPFVAATPWMAKLSVQPGHTWFGQPHPAVLVD